MPQALNEAGLYLCADDTVSFIRIRIFKKEKSVIHRLFVTLSMVVDNKLSIHFKDNKTKFFFLSWKETPPKLNISCGDYSLKQHNTVEYIGCYRDSNLNGEPMARKVFKRFLQSEISYGGKRTI